MIAERLNRGTSTTLFTGLMLVGLLVALPRPANAQGIGLEQLREMLAWGTASLILFDQLEYAPGAEGRPLSLDAVGWFGGDFNRLWFRAEGEHFTSGGMGELEAQLSYGRLVTAYFDALAGVRVDQRWGEESAMRGHLALGLVGLAPASFEVSPALFVSQGGDISARFEAAYQLLVTQRWIASPEVELNAALQEVPEWGIGSGLNEVELGLRLRYEFRREFAPYVGYFWTRRLGGSADFARQDGESVSDKAFVAGVRVWR